MSKNKTNLQMSAIILVLATGMTIYLVRPAATQEPWPSPQTLQDLKIQLKAELKEEIKQEVLAEMKAEIAQLVAEEINRSAEQAKGQNFNPALAGKSNERESVTEALRRTVRETLLKDAHKTEGLSDGDLDNYYASGDVEPAVEVAPGLTKSKAEMQLARNEAPTLKEQGIKASDSMEVKERPESLERTLQQRGSILLPKGTLQFEPSLTYAHFSSNRINIQGFSILPVLVIGDISTQEVKRDIFINTYSVKYGLLNNLQTEIKVPFRYEYDRETISSTSETSRSSGGMGDVEMGMSRQIGWEDGLMPDLVAAINVKSNTGRGPYNHTIGLGTGHWALRGSLIAAKSSDPQVIFGSLNYTYNFERENIDNFGTIKPGETIGYSLGTAIALSYQTSISFNFDHSVTLKMIRNDRPLADSFLNSASFRAGLNWAISEKRSVDFGVSIGLTEDAPAFAVEARYPITF